MPQRREAKLAWSRFLEEAHACQQAQHTIERASMGLGRFGQIVNGSWSAGQEVGDAKPDDDSNCS